MIIEATPESPKSTPGTTYPATRSIDDPDPVEVPPPYTHRQPPQHALSSPLTYTSTTASTSSHMPDTTTSYLSSPLSPLTPQSPLYSEQQRLLSRPILRVSTIPYDFHASNASELSGTSSPTPSLSTIKPSRRSLGRFFTSFFVAFGIIFLWLLFVQCIRIVVFGHHGLAWPGPPPHHGPPPGPPGHGGRRDHPAVVKPSFGTSRPYVAHPTRFPSARFTTSGAVPTPTEALSSGTRRLVITTDR
ncbi:hypothetical protein NP233_g9582 [Leucocoprinus birnbaumii]|uniref:Uncharacterized protein n=1 Tax=Leucocoprinus birnbaumii TaxID=56174 RepID=A0AAD5YM35_9AGAR|nr:hypothetical protein NP233_g9582 [Leucocoprinus birnbaumii]